MQVGFAEEFVEILAEDVEGGEGPQDTFQIRLLAIRNAIGRFFRSSVLNQVVITPPLRSHLVVERLERRRLYHLVRILRNRALVLYAGSLRDNRTDLRHNVLRLTPQNLAIFLGNGIYLATDIEQQISVTIGERLEIALVNRHELIRFEEVLFKQKILLPENFGEGLMSYEKTMVCLTKNRLNNRFYWHN